MGRSEVCVRKVLRSWSSAIEVAGHGGGSRGMPKSSLVGWGSGGRGVMGSLFEMEGNKGGRKEKGRGHGLERKEKERKRRKWARLGGGKK